MVETEEKVDFQRENGGKMARNGCWIGGWARKSAGHVEVHEMGTDEATIDDEETCSVCGDA